MEWSTPINLYCERLTPGFWGEPINALSNLSFIIAAIWCFYEAKREHKLDKTVISLIILATCVGIGSFLFHTFANYWSSFADVIPIWSFVALYVIATTSRITQKSPYIIAAIVATITLSIGAIWIFLLLSNLEVDIPHDHINGSSQYIPALIILWIFALKTYHSLHHIYKWFFVAALLFTLSLMARTVDLWVADIIPIGTHFIWHILNGTVIALLLQGFLKIKNPTEDKML